MVRSRKHLILEVGPLGMAGVACSVRAGKGAASDVASVGSISGLRVVSAPRPADCDWADPVAVGKWVRTVLNEHGLRGRRATLVIGRGEVVQRRLTLAASGLKPGELPGAVRLQMLRSLALAADDSAVDYLVENEGSAESAGVAISAAALPGARVKWHRAMAAAAGLSVASMRLRALGVATILSGASHRTAGAVIGVSQGAGGVEMLVVDDGRVLYSRALEGDVIADSDEGVARLAADAKRTWTAYRTTPEGRDADGLVVLGSAPHAHELARACGMALDLPARTLGEDEVQAGLRDESADPAGWCFALAGVLRRELSAADDIDFSNPKKPEKPRSRLGPLAGAAAAVLLLAAGGYATMGWRELARLDQRATALREELAEVRRLEAASVRDGARLDHAAHWLATNVSWTEHLATVGGMLPDAQSAVLDSVVAAARPRLEYVKGKSSVYDPARWRSAVSVDISLTGRTISRTIAEELRALLVKDARYAVTPVGDDAPAASGSRYPEAFALRLAAAMGRIEADDAADAAPEADDAAKPSSGGES